MSESELFPWLLGGWFVLSAATFAVLRVIPAPYGRHARPGWGPRVSARGGWALMEAPAALTPAILFLGAGRPQRAATVVLLLFWEVHYAYRAFVFPWGLRDPDRSMPVLVVVSGMLFNGVNGYLNGRWLFTLSPAAPAGWLGDPRFLVGTLLFFGGMAVTRQADATLRRLRRGAGRGYAIPRGGLFRWVSCPNYLGEMIQWGGWAAATWSLPGLSFFTWTVANLFPRALSHHRWYRRTFADYPKERKAIVPGLL